MKFEIHRAKSGYKGAPVPEAKQVDREWFVEIADLDALMALIKREGTIILYGDSDDAGITIYDDFIE